MSKRSFLLAIPLALGLTAVTARADIFIYEGNNNDAFPVDNVIFNTANAVNEGTTVVGETNQGGQLVYFTGTETLTAEGGIGQATIDALDGRFESLLISLTPPPPDQTQVYRSIVFDVAVTGMSGPLTINVYEPG